MQAKGGQTSVPYTRHVDVQLIVLKRDVSANNFALPENVIIWSRLSRK